MTKRSALSKVEFDVFTIYADFNPYGRFTQLYHYTNAVANQKILDGKTLNFQLTKTDAFLDKNEGTSILEPYYHACGHLYETGKIDLEFFLIARSITAQMLRDHDTDLWALCLTPHGCSSFMKERYAPNDGWILSFTSDALAELWLAFPKKYGRFERIQIQYSFKKMKRLMESILKKIYYAYKKDLETQLPNVREAVTKLLLHIVYYYGLRYKGKEYQEEKEVRLLFRLAKNVRPFIWTSKVKNLEVRFSNNGGEESVHLILGSPYFYQATQKMSIYNDERLNSPRLTSETIQKVLSEKK